MSFPPDLLLAIKDLLLAAIGFAAGTLGSLLGLGGGFIIVPSITFMGFSPYQIASTSLFAVFSTSVSSTITYARQKRVNYALGTKLAVISIPGSVLGAYVSDFISMESFMLYFGLVLIGTAFYIMRRSALGKEYSPKSGALMMLVYVASFFAGILSSLFGIGGGVIFVPLLVAVLGMPIHTSTATSQFIFLISSAAGIIAHLVLGHPDYTSALILVVGAFVGAQLGAKISLSVRAQLLQKLVSIALFVVAARLIIDVFV